MRLLIVEDDVEAADAMARGLARPATTARPPRTARSASPPPAAAASTC